MHSSLFWNFTHLPKKVNPLSQVAIKLRCALKLAALLALTVGMKSVWAADLTAVKTPELRYSIVAELPHDPNRFTEGLELRAGELWESTGLYGKSAVYVNAPGKSQARLSRALDRNLFGEGLSIVGDRVIQLTWREGIALLYDLKLRPQGQFHYSGEGWGLTHLIDPSGETRLVMSDGSAVLRILDGRDFSRVGSLVVKEHGLPISSLNELEVVDDRILANVWMTDRIAVISPNDGNVLGWLELATLRSRMKPFSGARTSDQVLNGIAYDPQSGHLLVTGKCWPKLFELKVEGFGKKGGEPSPAASKDHTQ